MHVLCRLRLRRVRRVAAVGLVTAALVSTARTAASQTVPTPVQDPPLMVRYSRCLEPPTPTRLAASEAEQTGCRRWSAFETRQAEIDLGRLKRRASASANEFLDQIITGLYGAEMRSAVTTTIYNEFRNWDWSEVQPAQSKAGTLIVWPGAAGLVTADQSTDEERRSDFLSGLIVLYAKDGVLLQINANKLHADVSGGRRPRFIVPVAKKTIFWNAWVEHGPSGVVIPDGRLIAGNIYRARLDLARFDYREINASEPGPATGPTKRYLETLRTNHPAIWILATPMGRGVRVLDGLERRFIRPNVDEPVGRGGRRPAETPADLSRSVTALLLDDFDRTPRSMLVSIEANELGCAAIAFSIWNSLRTRLLDYVVKPVTVVGKDGTSPGACDRYPELTVQTPDAPNLALLKSVSDARFDGAFHVFERRGPTNGFTVVVYADQASGRTWSWPVPSSLAQMESDLSTQSNNESKLTSPQAGYLTRLGNVLKTDLFGPAQNDDVDEARTALSALRQLAVNATDERPRILARITNADSQPVFLPLHLLPLSNDADADPLGLKITVAHEMPAAVTSAPDRKPKASCIDTWNVVMPHALAMNLLDKPAPDATVRPINDDDVSRALGPLRHQTLISEWTLFLRYLNGDLRSEQPEGFVLLAHHGDDKISFESPQIKPLPATVAAIGREFGTGSLAVLAACSVSYMPTEASARGILTHLSTRGLSAAIVSQFLIPPSVGGKLLRELARQVRGAQAAGREARVEELLLNAIAELRRGNELDVLARDRLFEFMIVGDDGVKVCK